MKPKPESISFGDETNHNRKKEEKKKRKKKRKKKKKEGKKQNGNTQQKRKTRDRGRDISDGYWQSVASGGVWGNSIPAGE